MRLTYKEKEDYFSHSEGEALDKLGQLEDVEEELGIDLIILFKALKNGIHFKVGHKFYFTNELNLDFTNECLFEFNEYKDYEIYEFEDYGNTWALTKEELL